MNMDRRVFAGLLTCAAAQIAAARVLPPMFEPALSDWTIDDMAGTYPRYAEPIGFGRTPSPGPVNPLDTLFSA